MPNLTSGPWSGPPKIVLGLDIGATHSAASFTYLYKGSSYNVVRVAEWPGQPAHRGQSRVPSLVWYDKKLKPMAFGAAALSPEIEEQAEKKGWRLISLFKLHLHPESVTKASNLAVQPLPKGLSLLKVYTDYMRYLLGHIKKFFGDGVLGGREVWESCQEDMAIVLTHPSGWGFNEQSILRQATVDAGYVLRSKLDVNVSFVSEAEASMHFCLFKMDTYQLLEKNATFVVCDAGGSTVDTISYRVASVSPTFEIEEIKTSACVQAGGAHIDEACRSHLFPIIRGVKLHKNLKKDALRDGTRHFEENAKREFENVDKDYRVNLGTGRLVDSTARIARGAITLSGRTVQSFFDVPVRQTVTSIIQQMPVGCRHVFLVGGFGESMYLRAVVASSLEAAGRPCSVHITREPNAKPVADGAVLWYGHNCVTSRATRIAYGISIRVPYDPSNPDHRQRKISSDANGTRYVDGQWCGIAQKGEVMAATRGIREKFCLSFETPNPPLQALKLSIPLLASASDDAGGQSKWSMTEDGHLSKGVEKVCTINADLSTLRGALEKRGGKHVYYHLEFRVVLHVGGTQLKAAIEWTELGTPRTGPATLVASLPPEAARKSTHPSPYNNCT